MTGEPTRPWISLTARCEPSAATVRPSTEVISSPIRRPAPAAGDPGSTLSIVISAWLGRTVMPTPENFTGEGLLKELNCCGVS